MCSCEPHTDKMRHRGISPLGILSFCRNLARLRRGEKHLLSEADLQPVGPLASLEGLGPSEEAEGRRSLARTVHIVLNGGLATSMGGQGPKALLEVRPGRTFLDVLLSRTSGPRLLFMLSSATQQGCLPKIEQALGEDRLPWHFLQHEVPRLDPETLLPISWPEDPEREWCPPGHGDLYVALADHGLLPRLLEAGYRYAFVSNVDNLAAWPDPRILGHMVRRRLPFLMEVCARTAADRKGGHLARTQEGYLVLRERAQCPPEDLDAFEDTKRYPWFNTNNLWIDLQQLSELLENRGGLLDLPLILNLKPTDPARPESPPALQLETAAGAAIEVFEGADALAVPRSRFAPVKTLGDLLAVRSDAYVLREAEGRLEPAVMPPPAVRLDRQAFVTPLDLDRAFPHGPPSLKGCCRLEVRGKVRFGRNVVVQGEAVVLGGERSPLHVPNGALVTGVWQGP